MSKYDDIKAQKILNAIEDGQSRRCAAGLAGVSYNSLKNWINRGRRGDEPRFAEFLTRLEEADARAEAPMVQKIRAGAPGWQGASCWLERRRRWTWRRPTFVTDDPSVELYDDAKLEEMQAKLIADLSKKAGG